MSSFKSVLHKSGTNNKEGSVITVTPNLGASALDVEEYFDSHDDPSMWEDINDGTVFATDTLQFFRTVPEVIQSHAGIFETIGQVGGLVDSVTELSSAINALRRFVAYDSTLESQFSDNCVSRLEDLALFVISISQASSFNSVLVPTIQYAKTFLPGSMTIKLVTFLRSRQAQHLHVQSGGPEVSVSEIINDWRAYRDHPLAKLLGDVITLLSICGVAPSYGENFLCSEIYDLLGAKVNKSYTSATRFLDVVTSIFKYVVNNLLPCIEKGDVGLLLLSDEELMTLEDKYSSVLGCKQYVDVGRLDLISPDTCPFSNEADLDHAISALISELSLLCKKTKSEYVKSSCTTRLVALKKLQVSLHLERTNHPLKEQPFAVKVFGGSSVGKSKFTLVLMEHLAHALGIPYNADTVCHQNAAETKYDSNYKSKHTIMILDDVCNKHPAKEIDSPTDRMLRIINMQPATALKAGVDDKGVNPYMVKLLAATTNVWNLHAHTFSIEPASILRRFNLHFEIRLKSSCVGEDGGPLPGCLDGMYPDAYEIDIYKVKLNKRSKLNLGAHNATGFSWELVKENASLLEALSISREEAVEFSRRQKVAVQESNSYYNADHCSQHGFIKEACPLCAELSVHAGTFDGLDLADCNADSMDEELPPLSLVEAIGKTLRQYQTEIVGAGSFIAIALIILQIWSAAPVDKREVDVQGSANSIERAPRKLENDKPNMWKPVQITPLPRTLTCETTSFKDLLAYVKKHVAIFEYVPLGADYTKPEYTMALPYRENVWVVPYHVVKSHPKMQVVVRLGGIFDAGTRRGTSCIGVNSWERVGKQDLALVRLPGAGDVPNLSKFFSPRAIVDVPRTAATVIRDFQGSVSDHLLPLDGIRIFDNFFGDSAKDLSGAKIFYTKFNTFKPYKGLCMMPLISFTSKPTIIGFHVGGSEVTSLGVAERADADSMAQAFSALNTKSPLRVCSTGDFPKQVLGMPIEVHGGAHKKYCARFMPYKDDEGRGLAHGFDLFGEHNLGTMTFRSQVRKSVISDALVDLTGIPRIHGPPNRAPPWRDFQRELDLITSAINTFDPEILDAAFKAEKRFWDKLLDQYDHSDIAPLPDIYAINGLDGVAGLDKIDRNTSMGLPVRGAKKKKMFQLDILVEGVTDPWDFTEESGVYDEVERLRLAYLGGRRGYLLFSATEKDEPTKFTKDKRRIFAGCPVAGVILIRKYFLPILRFIQRNWLDTGSAVGINAHGFDWDRFYHRLIKYGEDRIVAGDYSSFDKRVTSEITLRSAHIFLHIAERCGYSEEDLIIMRGLVTDMVYPIYDWQGAFICMLNSMPSGVPITVHFNNFNNRLYMRYAHYAEYVDRGYDACSVHMMAPSFEDVTSCFTYGDDNIMSISPEEPYLNHTVMQNQLEKIGVKYTMADKESKSKPFIHVSQSDFLKRGFYRHENGYITAPLDKDSILKSLHNFMKRKNSDVLPEDIAAASIYSAMLEFYQHGFDEFHWWREKLTQVADETEVQGMEEKTLLSFFPNNELPNWGECSERYFATMPLSDSDSSTEIGSDLGSI